MTGFREPPPSYRKKLINQGGDCPLIRTYTEAQVSKRIAQELFWSDSRVSVENVNEKRDKARSCLLRV